jgi:hypothetical protein
VVMIVFEDMAKPWVRACCPAEMESAPRFGFFGREDARDRMRGRRVAIVFALSSAGESEVRIP